jgi:hypothetical protein
MLVIRLRGVTLLARRWPGAGARFRDERQANLLIGVFREANVAVV